MPKKKKKWKPYIGSEYLSSKYREGIDVEKCALLIKKSGNDKRRKEQQYKIQDKIRNLGGKETNKLLEIVEKGTNKQTEMKEKKKKEYLRKTRTTRNQTT